MIIREVFRHFLLMERPIINMLDEVLDSFDLTLPERKAMEFIEESGTCTLIGVARYLSIKKPSVTRMINCMEEKHLVEQIIGKDKREKRIQLTSRGKEVSAACRNALDKVELDLLNGISDEEQKILLRSLMTIRDNLRQAGSK